MQTDTDTGNIDHGDADAGDYDQTEVKKTVVNAWHPSHAPAAIPELPVNGSAQIAREALDMALSLLTGKGANAEAIRAGVWNKTRLPVRRVAMMAAKMPKERADDALAKMNALERGLVNLALADLIVDLQNLQRAMHGGHVPVSGGVH